MAHIVLKNIEFKNLLSYGATSSRIDIQNGLHWIRGANGHGKSTVIEAVNYALFGKAYRDISLSSLVNNYNGKKMLVKLELDKVVNGNSTTYIIYRGLKPKKFEIYKGEVKKENRIDEEGKAGIFQSYLENEILGFNEVLFKHTIAMSAMSSTPFLEMKKDEKRKFIEAILGVSDIEKIKKAFNSELSDSKSEFVRISSKIPERESKLEELQELLENAKKEKTQDIAAIEDEIVNIEKEIVDLEEKEVKLIDERDGKKEEGKKISEEYDEYKHVVRDLIQAEANLKAYAETFKKNEDKIALSNKTLDSLKDYSEDNYNSLITKKQKISSDISNMGDIKLKREKFKFKLDSDLNEIDKINNELHEHAVGVPCDRCKRPYTEKEYDAVKQSVASKLSELTASSESIKKEITSLDKSIVQLDALEAEIKEIESDIEKSRASALEFKSASEVLKSCEEENAKLGSKIEHERALISDLKTKVKTHDLLNAKLGQLRTEFLDLKHEVENIQNKISDKKGHIIGLNQKIEKRKSNKIDDVISMTEKRIQQAIADIQTANEKVKEYSNEINLLKYIVNMFGDEGIKEYMIKKYVPVLNKSIDRVLKSFGVPFSISFDSTMDHEFSNSFGLAKEYKGLSEGQKRRLNFSIYIAFREFVNKIGRFTINTLFLDEILDTAMDDSGLEDMVNIIKNKVHDLGAVYLISHKINSLNEEFENIHDVNFDGTFSVIKK